MSVNVKIHPMYRILTDQKAVAAVEGNTLLDCLTHLVDQYPQLRKELFKEDGSLSDIPAIFVNKELIANGLLTKPITSSDVIRIEIFIAGG